MKTLTITEGRQNLGRWLKLAMKGIDVGFLIDGKVVALRPVEVHSADYALMEYGVSERQVDRAHQSVKKDFHKAKKTGGTTPFNGSL